MQDHLYTLGYEGLTFETFLACLRSANIKVVLDVRANPLSRKRGFSKRGLAAALRLSGLSYVHLPALGCPKNVRDRYKDDQDWARYTRGFLAHLSKQSAAIEELVRTAIVSPSCLICFEADFGRCHRAFVARAVARAAPLQITHLTAEKTIPDAIARVAA